MSFVVLAGAAAFLTYRVTTEHNDVEDVTPASFLLTSTEDVSFTTPNGGEHKGWLLRGLRGAPVILICHGYGTNRSDGLSLGTVLQENHFNVYLFNFRGSKKMSSMSDLGPSYIETLKAAIQIGGSPLAWLAASSARRLSSFDVSACTATFRPPRSSILPANRGTPSDEVTPSSRRTAA